MKEINEEALVVLRNNTIANQIEIDYVDIEKHFENKMLYLEKICDDAETTLDDLLKFLKENHVLDELNGWYKYCKTLNASYVEFKADYQHSVQELIKIKNNIDDSLRKNPESYDEDKKAIESVKERFKNDYESWIKSYSIRKTYGICKRDESIILFSHRTSGFSNPVYQLTPNFSVEIKTNFGYGRSSYFYTKLKYKNIDITPFSDWINYRFAQFSELIRYTKSHALYNHYWLEAVEFAKDACELSIADERKFVEKYIIDECEEMAQGLEDFFIKDTFSFKGKQDKMFEVSMTGHVLIDFRGEKISGALDFIDKIIEFDKVASIQSFIKRIEKINKKMEPILEVEPELIKETLLGLNKEKDTLQPDFDKVRNEYLNYNKKIKELQSQMRMKGEFDPSSYKSQEEYFTTFRKKYPEYENCNKKYILIRKDYTILEDKIHKHNKILENIISYKEKIHNYFK